jgi:hypothetical protein
MKIKLLYITMIVIFFCTQACKRSEPDCGDLSDEITNYNIADSNKAKIPYTGTDTLVFVSNSNDTAVLIGQGKKSFQTTTRNSIAGGDCPKSAVNNYQNIQINFIGNDSTIKNINFNVYKNNQLLTPSFTDFDISIDNLLIATNNFEYVNYQFKSPNDSIILDNKYQKGVFIDNYSNKTTLFNFAKGLLRFKDKNNKTWTKNK